ncbi:hypothetical protein ACP4OV_008403 [Aristida adscensionis]
MASRAGNTIAAVAVMTVLAAAAAVAAAAVSCGDAVDALVPCGEFLLGAGAAPAAAGPSDRCCRGARALERMAGTAEARRAVCRCLEQAAPSFGVLPGRARLLAARCNLGLAVPIGANTDCDIVGGAVAGEREWRAARRA